MTEVEASVCPLCLQGNDCAMAKGASGCWCEGASIPAAVLDRVPQPFKGTVCICRRCAEGVTTPPGNESAR